MGKRELFIIIAFVVVGAAVVSVHGAARQSRASRASRSARSSAASRRKSAPTPHRRTSTRPAGSPAPSTLTELRVTTARSVPLTIVGEAARRHRVRNARRVHGPGRGDRAGVGGQGRSSRRRPRRRARADHYFPEEGTQNATLTLNVPARLAVRVENSGRVKVSRRRRRRVAQSRRARSTLSNVSAA